MCNNYKSTDVSIMKKIIGRKIKGTRLSSNLSQKQMTINKKISLNTLKRIERGTDSSTLDTLLHAAIILDIPLAPIFECVDIYRRTGLLPNDPDLSGLEDTLC